LVDDGATACHSRAVGRQGSLRARNTALASGSVHTTGGGKRHLWCFFSEVPVLPASAVLPVKEMHFGIHVEIQAIAFLTRP